MRNDNCLLGILGTLLVFGGKCIIDAITKQDTKNISNDNDNKFTNFSSTQK